LKTRCGHVEGAYEARAQCGWRVASDPNTRIVGCDDSALYKSEAREIRHVWRSRHKGL
jgi:hypothetical protein